MARRRAQAVRSKQPTSPRKAQGSARARRNRRRAQALKRPTLPQGTKAPGAVYSMQDLLQKQKETGGVIRGGPRGPQGPSQPLAPRAQARTRGDAKAFMSPSQAKAFMASQAKPMQLGVGPSQLLAPRARARAAGLATSFMNPSQARAFQNINTNMRNAQPGLFNANIGLNLASQNRQAAALGTMGNVAQRPIANNDGGMGFIGAPMGSKSASNYTRKPMNL